MGHYNFMRGNVTIKPELLEALRPRFTFKERDPSDDDDWGYVPWEKLELPESITSSPQWLSFLVCEYAKHTPGGLFAYYSQWNNEEGRFGHNNGLGSEGRAVMHLEENVLTFYCSSKDCGTQKAFIKLLPLIADNWRVERDITDTAGYRHYYEGEHIWLYQYPDTGGITTPFPGRDSMF